MELVHIGDVVDLAVLEDEPFHLLPVELVQIVLLLPVVPVEPQGVPDLVGGHPFSRPVHYQNRPGVVGCEIVDVLGP